MKKIKILLLCIVMVLCIVCISCNFNTTKGVEYINWETETTEGGFEWIKGTKILKEYHGEETDVVIPEGCTEIRWLAFKNESGKKMERITLPASVSELPRNAFDNCYNLKEFIVSEDNAEYCSENGILYTKDKTHVACYPIGKKEDTYSMKEEELNIGNFKNSQIKTLYLNENTRFINDEMELSERLKSMSSFDVLEMPKLEYIICKSEPNIRKVAGVYTDESEEDSSYIVKATFLEGTTKVEDDILDGCQYLKYVTIPEGVTSVGSFAFRWNRHIESIVFPKSLEKIRGNFSRSNDLRYIIMKRTPVSKIKEIFKESRYDFASPEIAKRRKLYTGLDVSVNGTLVDFDFSCPFIDRGKILVPISYILEACEIPYIYDWDEESGFYYVKKGEGEVKIPLDKYAYISDVSYYPIDNLKTIMEVFDMDVTYDKNNYMINITDKVK